jgi:hypothetical protein
MVQKLLTARDAMQDLADNYASQIATLEAITSMLEFYPEWQESQLKPLLDIVKDQEGL